MFSTRTEHRLQANSFAERVTAKAANGQALLDLTISNPTRADLPYSARTLLPSLRRGALHPYEPDARGLIRARECICREWALRGVALDPHQVLLTGSTSEAYSLAFKVLTDPGDEVLVPEPSYPLIEHLATFEGVMARPYRLAYDGTWHIDFDSVARSIGPRTRALVVVNPNNPTGSYVKRSELTRLAELGLPIVSDEVFLEFPLEIEPRERVPALTVDAPLVLAFDGLSKRAALPQLKLAWIGVRGQAALVTEALARLEVVADMYLSPNTPVQHALPDLLEHTLCLGDAIRARLTENLTTLRAELRGTGGTALRVEGGWSAIVRLPNVVGDWAELLLEGDNLVVQPGWFYDLTDGAYVVVSLLTPTSQFHDGIGRLTKRLATLK